MNVRLHPRTCGTPEGLAAHEAAGTEACTWCVRASAPPEPPEPPREPEPEPVPAPAPLRHYRTAEGVIIAGDPAHPPLARLIAAGLATEVAAP